MSTTTAVGVNNDFASCQARIAMRTTNDKFARWIHMIFDAWGEKIPDILVVDFLHHPRNENLLHVLLDFREHLLVGLLLVEQQRWRHKLVVLRGNNDGVDAQRLSIIAVLYRHLTLRVWAQVGHLLALATNVSQGVQDMVTQIERQRQIVFRLIHGISKHHALVASALVFRFLSLHATVDIATLLMDGIEHATALCLELILGFRVANPLDGFTCHFQQIDVGTRFHFACYHHLSRGHKRFTSHFGIGIVCQEIVQNSITNLVGHLVRMSLTYRL